MRILNEFEIIEISGASWDNPTCWSRIAGGAIGGMSGFMAGPWAGLASMTFGGFGGSIAGGCW